MNSFIKAVGGKKNLWLLIAVLCTIFKDKIGIDAETLKWLWGGTGVGMLGQGYADGQSGGATSHGAAADDK